MIQFNQKEPIKWKREYENAFIVGYEEVNSMVNIFALIIAVGHPGVKVLWTPLGHRPYCTSIDTSSKGFQTQEEAVLYFLSGESDNVKYVQMFKSIMEYSNHNTMNKRFIETKGDVDK